jgi:DNA-binding NarL/FixJ family response regulator
VNLSETTAAEDRIRVLVVGESPIARTGLEAALLQQDCFEVVGATNLAGATAMFESTGAAAVLMEGRTFSAWRPAEIPSEARLTAREIEVLRLVADGASNKIIAHKLGISDHTAKFHVGSILSKLNAATRTEAVTLGVKLGLVYL